MHENEHEHWARVGLEIEEREFSEHLSQKKPGMTAYVPRGDRSRIPKSVVIIQTGRNPGRITCYGDGHLQRAQDYARRYNQHVACQADAIRRSLVPAATTPKKAVGDKRKLLTLPS